jgi:hypothetical protein
MDDLTEIAWRKALRERGTEWVMAQLRTRPGRPEDVVFDVVFEPPYPTRGFCQSWCGEQDNRIFRFSWHTLAAIAMLLLFIICFCQAVASWNDHELIAARDSAAPMSASPPRAARGGGSNFSDTIPNSYASPGSGSSSSSSPPSLCSYITYNTAQCPQVQR